MNLLSSRGLLALAAVVDIALHARSAPVPAKALAARHELAPRRLETLLQELARANILKGHRGPRGGYELARERRRITAAEIVQAAARMTDRGSKPKLRPRLVEAVLEPALEDASQIFLAQLERISVDDLCRRAEAEAGLIPSGIDFAI